MTPATAVVLTAAATMYLAGAERLWRHAGRGRVVRAVHVAWWVAGLAAVGAAVSTPVEAVAAERFAVHMGQHLVLVVVAPLLLLAARPALPLAWSLPERVRRVLPRPHPSTPALLAVAATAYVAVLYAWHLPVAYEWAVESTPIHLAEHVSLLAAGTALLAAVVRRDPRGRVAGTSVVAAALTAALSGALGALLTFSDAPWYETYASAGARGGWDATADQVLGGVLMWVGGGLCWTAVAVVRTAVWLRSLGAAEEGRGSDAAARRTGNARHVAAWVLVVAVGAGCTPRGTPAPTAEVVGDIAEGRDLVVSRGCVTCHDIPGIPAHSGRVGPSLDGVGSRSTIAGVLPNTPSNLARWVRDPQGVLPGNVMPDVGLSEEEAEAVAAFLSRLD